MAWVYLILASALEPVWAAALDASDGFRRWKPTTLFLLTMIPSLWLLSHSMTVIPVGTAYAVFVGIGAGLVVIISAVRGTEKLTRLRGGLLVLLIGSVVGLRVVS